MLGVVLSLGVYLYRNMKPRIALLSRTPRGDYRDAQRWGLESCRHVAVIRFHSALFFANVNYLEDVVLETVASMPELKHVLIAGGGMNDLDASGEVLLSQLVSRLREENLDLSFSGLNDHVLDTMKRTHLFEKIGEDHFYHSIEYAARKIHAEVCEHSSEHPCPLLQAKFTPLPVETAAIKEPRPWFKAKD